MTPIGDVLDPEGEVAVDGVKESGSVLWGPWYGGGGFIPVPSRLLFLDDEGEGDDILIPFSKSLVKAANLRSMSACVCFVGAVTVS